MRLSMFFNLLTALEDKNSNALVVPCVGCEIVHCAVDYQYVYIMDPYICWVLFHVYNAQQTCGDHFDVAKEMLPIQLCYTHRIGG